MDSKIEKIKKTFSIDKNEKMNFSDENDSLQPLILNQVDKNTKGTKSMPYKFGTETYEVYSNPKNPFIVGILAADTDRIKLNPINTKNLFQQFEKSSTYSIEYPLNISAHRKRRVSSLSKKTLSKEKKHENVLSVKNVNDSSKDYLPIEKLKEDKFKLQIHIKSFCNHILNRIRDNHNELNIIIDEIVPMFVKHQIRIRFYEAFRQIFNIDDLIITLEKICDEFELENFELFCSAIFVFYSSQK